MLGFLCFWFIPRHKCAHAHAHSPRNLNKFSLFFFFFFQYVLARIAPAKRAYFTSCAALVTRSVLRLRIIKSQKDQQEIGGDNLRWKLSGNVQIWRYIRRVPAHWAGFKWQHKGAAGLKQTGSAG